MAKTTTLKEFESVFPKLEEALLEYAKAYKLPEQMLSWYKQVSTMIVYLCRVPKRAMMLNLSSFPVVVP